MADDCSRFSTWIGKGGAGLTSEDKRLFDEHLGGCSDCRELVQMLDTAMAERPSSYEQLLDLPEVDTTLYLKQRVLGMGGMGETHLAFERRLGRSVALKELRRDRDPEVLEPVFEREARLTARLQHPSIVSIYEAGRFGPGRPFYAMRLVDGTPLGEEIARRPTLEERLALVAHVATVAQAIAYAHDQRIVHRDLKPANIVVGRFGEVVVIDWGLAIDLDELPGGTTSSGTLQYMPPEQARGERPDESGDIYAIGATLYHVLAGDPPYSGSGQPLVDLLVRSPEPLDQRVAGVPRDLLAIVGKAMARERVDRYPTATALADDLQRFLAGRLVGAYEYGRSERFVRWVKRHRIPVTVAVMGLALSATIATVSVRRIIQRNEELVVLRAQDLLDTDPTASLAWLAQYPGDGPESEKAGGIKAEAVSRGIAHHVFATNSGPVSDVAVSSDDRWVASAGTDGTVRLWSAATGDERVLMPAGAAMMRVAFASGGDRLAAAGADGSIRWWDLATLTVHEFAGPGGTVGAHTVATLAWSPDGTRIASGGKDRIVHVWDVATSAAITRDVGWEVFDLAFAPDGTKLAAGGRLSNGIAAAVWDLKGDLTQLVSKPDTACSCNRDVFSVQFAANDVVVTAGRSHVCVWNAPFSAVSKCERQTGVVRRVAVNGDELGFGDEEGAVFVWRWRTEAKQRLGRFPGAVTDCEFATGGSTLITGSLEGEIRAWNVTGRSSRRLIGQRDIKRLAVGRDLLVSASLDHSVRVWPVRVDSMVQLGEQNAATNDVAWMGSGLAAIAKGATDVKDKDDANEGVVRVWPSIVAGSPVQTCNVGGWPRRIVAAGGSAVAVVGGDDKLRMIDIVTCHCRELAGHTDEVFDIAAFPDGRIVTGGIDGKVLVWEADHPRMICQHDGGVWVVAIARDGGHVASAGFDGTVHWTNATGVCSVPLGQHGGRVNALAIDEDGTHVVSGGTDGLVVVWSTLGGERVQLNGQRDGHQCQKGPITSVAMTRDGRVLSGARDGTVCAWPLAGVEGKILARHHKAVTSIAVSPDGRLVASSGFDGTVWLLELATPHFRVFRFDGPIRRVAFSPDGRSLVISGASVQVIPVTDVTNPDGTTTARVTPNNEIATPAR